MQSENAEAGPSRPRIPRKPKHPFVSANEKPDKSDGIFRVVIISSGSVASIKVPEIVGALSKDADIAVQVVATPSSLHFYNQDKVDEAVRSALRITEAEDATPRPKDLSGEIGVKVWTDADEWSDWSKVGDPILHIELRRWADLVVVAPCSANMLAKIAGGLCDNLATSLLRALSRTTPTILCPAMNTHMYQHPLTADHLQVAQEKLGYLISGPQGAGRLACGDEGPGKMTDWRDIVIMIQDFAAMYRTKLGESLEPDTPLKPDMVPSSRPPTPPTPGRIRPFGQPLRMDFDGNDANQTVDPGKNGNDNIQSQEHRHHGPPGQSTVPAKTPSASAMFLQDWRQQTDDGRDGSVWQRKWWMG